MGLSRRQFTKEFKLAAIQRLEMGASVEEVARAFEVNPNVLHRWRREFRQGPGSSVDSYRPPCHCACGPSETARPENRIGTVPPASPPRPVMRAIAEASQLLT